MDETLTPATAYSRIRDEMNRVLIGQEDIIKHLTFSLFTRGHVLLEGLPGVAKTTTANLMAEATGLSYSRIQMTPDVLPADITGTHVYREETGEFDLQKGPIFANLVVADEINRATPKTQSALLEAMQEGHVTIDGTELALPDPFMVIATQNPIELEGTYTLPEAQKDRFQFKLNVDVPGEADELSLLDRFDENPLLGPANISQVLSTEEIMAARRAVDDIYVDTTVKAYIRDLIRRSRTLQTVEYGGSPRAGILLLQSAKARAAVNDREYVTPDDVKALVQPVLNHRLILSTDAELSETSVESVIRELIDSVPTPSAQAAAQSDQA